MFTVLDVSRWQGRIDWDTVKASGRVHGVMLRALGSRSGTPYIDPMFETNYSACIRLGIPVGVYYYSCAVTAPQRDAELALLHDALRGKRLQLPAAIDVEDARLRALTPDALSALVAGAVRQLEHWGLYAMVYTYTHFADTALHMDTLAPFDLWLADYRGKRPARRHGMWQYTSRGRVPGISGPVDLSRTEKDYPALLHRAGVKIAICTDHPETPVQYLPLCAAMAVKGGLPADAALAAITIWAAEIGGVAHRVGSLTPGKDADIVITSGHPINLFSRVQTVLIGGQRIKG